MNVLLEIQDDKAPALLEGLDGLPYVKTERITDEKKDAFIADLKESVKQVNLAKKDKIKLKTLDELINEL